MMPMPSTWEEASRTSHNRMRGGNGEVTFTGEMASDGIETGEVTSILDSWYWVPALWTRKVNQVPLWEIFGRTIRVESAVTMYHQ